MHLETRYFNWFQNSIIFWANQKNMNNHWISFLLGFFIFPLLYAFIPAILGIKVKSKKIPPVAIPSIPMSEKLKNEITKSLKLNEELGWINVMIQRMFFDSIRNYNLEHKIRESILKSFSASIGEGLLKKVRIKSLNFGAEAPYLKHIKLITVDEYNEIIRIEEISDFQREILIEMDNSKILNTKNNDINIEAEKLEIENRNITDKNLNFENIVDSCLEMPKFSQLTQGNCNSTDKTTSSENEKLPNLSKLDNHSIMIENYKESKSTSKSSDEKDNNQIENSKFCDIFRNATFTGCFEYNGTVQMMIEVELPKNISISVIVTVKKIFSDFLFRIPALNSNTRCELTFINRPTIDIEVDSGIVNHLKKLYFQRSISRFIKKVALNSFNGTFVYPEWFQITQPNTSSTTFQNFNPILITIQNYQDAFDSADQILVITSSDFKIINFKSDILFKKSYSMLNERNFVLGWSFRIGAKVNKMSNYKSFECSSLIESKALSAVETLEILKRLFPALVDVITVFEMKNITILKMIFEMHEQEYIKVVYKNNIIFYKNNPRISEFFTFKAQDGNLIIFNYSDRTTDLFFNDKRIEKLKKMLEEEDFSVDKCEEFASTEETECKVSGLEIMFKEALRTDNSVFKKYSCELEMNKSVVKDFIKDSSLRLKLFEENGTLVGSVEETRNIRTLIIEYGDNNPKELRIHSLRDKKFIVDICPEREQTFIYKVLKIKNSSVEKDSKKKRDNFQTVDEQDTLNQKLPAISEEKKKIENRTSKDQEIINSSDSTISVSHNKEQNLSRCTLEILYKSKSTISFPNFFIEYIKIKESFQKYFYPSNQIPYNHSPNELKLETYVNSGTIYFEFRCNQEDDYSLELFSCKKQIVIFQIYKIITNKEFKLIYPVDNDYIRLTLFPKHKRNQFLEYKFKNFHYQKTILVDGMIGLNSNEKLKIKINGTPSHVIFWEKNSILPTRAYLQDSYGKTDVQDSGILRADSREYFFVIKNKLQKQRNISVYTGLVELK